MMAYFFPEKNKIYKVSELNLEIKQNLESSYTNIWVEGEISNFAFPNKKHIYFTLKDDYSMVKVAFFENSIKLSEFYSLQNVNDIFTLKDGLHVYVNGFVSIYDKRSEYQIIAKEIIPLREGSLLLAFEELKRKLENKGLFDEASKKKIPSLPQKIGLITSKNGAVVKDIIKILNKRFSNFHLILRNASVQGDQAAKEICSAIKDLEDYGVDVIIIARGGGSFEDLNCFNDETLAYTIFGCKIPIISGIGHQTDFTICDFVADVRAATPTHAAEIVIINKDEVLANIDFLKSKMFSMMRRKISSLKRELFLLSTGRLLKWPRTIINELWQYHDNISESLKNHIMLIIGENKRSFEVIKYRMNPLILRRKISMDTSNIEKIMTMIYEKYKNILRKKRSDVDIIVEKLKNSNPALILEKGYTITRLVKNGNLVKGIEMVNNKDLLVTIVRNGKIFSEVINKES